MNGTKVTSTARNRDALLSLVGGLVWPFAAALRDLTNLGQRRTLAGFVVFCLYGSWVFYPSPGSDAAAYLDQIVRVSRGFPSTVAEPIPAMLVNFVGRTGVPLSSYFVIIGLFYATIFRAVCNRLLDTCGDAIPAGFAPRFFLLSFLLNVPLFAVVNARYQLGLWVMMLATLLALERRWSLAVLAGTIGAMIHFGFVIFGAAAVIAFSSRVLGRFQSTVAYGFVLVSFALPSGFIIAISGMLGNAWGGGLGAKVAMTGEYAQKAVDNAGLQGAAETSWFLLWFSSLLFWALLASGTALWWRIRRDVHLPQFQLWMLILFMWGISNALGGDPETATRIERNATMLLLLFHARWFLIGQQGARLTVAITLAPILFYLTVSYRIWLGETSLVTILPSPFGFASDSFPRIFEFLVGRS